MTSGIEKAVIKISQKNWDKTEYRDVSFSPFKNSEQDLDFILHQSKWNRFN